MSKFKNFRLMLKQGIKGVFQFKAQFIIIIILAFVATFILSVSVSTQRNMQKSYDRIVKSQPKFSYSGNIQLNSNANSDSDPYLLLTEADNTAPVEFKVTSPDKKYTLEDSTSFNFVTYNGPKNDWYKQSDGTPFDTFITRGTAAYIKALTPDATFDSSVLNNYYLKELFNELTTISDNSKNNKQLKDFDSLTKYSPVAIYTDEHPDWFKPFIKDISSPKSPDQMFNLGSDTESIKDRDMFNNVVYGVSTLSGFLKNAVDNELKDTNAEKAVEFLFGTTISGTAKNSQYVVDGTTVKPYSTHINVDYKTPTKGQTYASYDPNKPSTATTTSDAAITYSGLRGITNPFIDRNTEKFADTKSLATDSPDEVSYLKIVSWDNFGIMALQNSGAHDEHKNLYARMNIMGHEHNGPKSGFFYSNELPASMINDISTGKNDRVALETAFRVHNKLNAAAAGFDYKLRREATYFDSNKQLKFRGIVINDNENFNLTYLRGRAPQAGEIAVNEQFAKKNKIKVGDNVAIGDALYLVSGIATDALSYLPSQDLANPIPNPKVSAFIYGDKETFVRISAGTSTSSGTNSVFTENLSYFLYDQKSTKISGTEEQRKNLFGALYSNDSDGAISNLNAIKAYVNNGTLPSSTSSHVKWDSFKESPYRYSNILQPRVFKIYDSITFIASAVIALIAIISVIVCVKKTIDLNSKQIGILKALGEQPGGISVNYISYAIILGLIVVPVAWLIGNVVQIPFGALFQTYFSVQPYTIEFDWISFVISFGVLGIAAGGFSFLCAWLLTKKPVLSILTSSIKWGKLYLLDWLEKKAFYKSSFSVRFSMILTSSGSRQIILMTVVMLIASFLMSLVLAIPSVAVRMNSSYYKSVKYANKYDEVPMIGNAPLSKNSISYWNGHDYLDDDYVKANLALDTSGAKYGYYKDVESYSSTNSAGSAFPQYVYDANAVKPNADENVRPNEFKNGVTDFNEYVLSHIQQLLSIIGSAIGNNYYTHLGVSFSVGIVDKIYGMLLHSYEDVTNMKSLTGDEYTDTKKLDEAQNLSGWLTSSVPKVISSIVGSFGGGDVDTGSTGSPKTWKEQVMDTLYSVIPSYVKGYVQQSDSRLDQYGIAFQNEIYIPGQETMTTQVDNYGSQYASGSKALQLTGLDKNQNSLIVNKKDVNKVFLTAKDKKEIMDRINVRMGANGLPDTSVFGQSVYAENDPGLLLYDASTHTFNFPILPNKSAESTYGLEKGKKFNNWNNLIQSIRMKTKDNNWFTLPKDAWTYDDTDYAAYLKSQDDDIAKGIGADVPYKSDPAYSSTDPNNNWEYDATVPGKYYLEPSRLDNNKLTFNTEFDGFKYHDVNTLVDQTDSNQTDKVTLKDRAMLFKGFKYDENGNPTGTYLRPYYQYKNFKLMIPQDWVDLNGLLYSSNDQSRKTTQWFKTDVDSKYIPKSVRDSFTKLQIANPKIGSLNDSSKWVVINPYDLNYEADNFSEDQKMALTNLVSAPEYWYYHSFDGSNAIMQINSQDVNMNTIFADSQGDPSVQTKVNLESVGTIDSYNDKLVVIDSDLANMMMNYPTYRSYEYNFQTFDKSSLIAAGTPAKDVRKDSNDNSVSQFDRYNFVKTYDPTFLNNDWSKDHDAMLNDVWNLSYEPYIKAIGGKTDANNNPNILKYAPHLFFTGKLSNIEEPLEYSSQYSATAQIRTGQTAIGLGNNVDGGLITIIKSATLLSTTKNLVKQLETLIIAIVAMLMIAIIITAALLIMLTGDIYIEQYKRFMVLLRALGYSKIQIFMYTFATVSIFSIIAWAVGCIVAWLVVYAGVSVLWTAGFAIPVGITWWPIVISFAVMFISYAGSLFVSSSKARKANPSEVLTATAE